MNARDAVRRIPWRWAIPALAFALVAVAATHHGLIPTIPPAPAALNFTLIALGYLALATYGWEAARRADRNEDVLVDTIDHLNDLIDWAHGVEHWMENNFGPPGENQTPSQLGPATTPLDMAVHAAVENLRQQQPDPQPVRRTGSTASRGRHRP